jgi:hypothetical protein
MKPGMGVAPVPINTMMTDQAMVDMLRGVAVLLEKEYGENPQTRVFNIAADKIDRLRNEVKTLREALEPFADQAKMLNRGDTATVRLTFKVAVFNRARTVLNGVK